MSNFPRLDETGLNTLLNKIATDVTGQLDDLETTEKSSLVGAINETRYKEWSGTQAQYAAAVAQGLIPDGTIVTITDSPTPTGDLNEHIATFIHSQSGVHGIRYYQDKLEYYDEELEEWVEIETGGGTTIVQIPSVVIGTYTYNGTEQAPVITGLDAEHTVITGVTASTTPGDFTFTIALKDPTKMVWSDMSITALTYNWSMAKAACPTTVSANSATLDADHLTASVTLSNVTGAVTVTSSDSTIATASLSGNTITISNVNQTNGSATITVSIAESQNYLAGSLSITVNAEFSQIYGVEWDGSSSPILTRTDAAEGFVDPNPYYSGMSGTPSSPFDNISPWKDMTIVHDDNAGDLVKIPKFYVKIGYHSETSGLKIQVSDKYFEGASVSPAHIDRGDGKGERDVVYFSRYMCSSDNFKSISGANTLFGTRAWNTNAPSITALGENIYPTDYLIMMTIWILYLVEYANFNSQSVIGKGCPDDASITGVTDSFAYHTGTEATSRDSSGHIKYRNIEDLYGVLYYEITGAYLSNSKLYISPKPSDFISYNNPIEIGSWNIASNRYMKNFKIVYNSSLNTYCLYPDSYDGSASTYICDWSMKESNGKYFRVGGGRAHASSAYSYGIFTHYVAVPSVTTTIYSDQAARLMKL